jgi:hypothetical protein
VTAAQKEYIIMFSVGLTFLPTLSAATQHSKAFLQITSNLLPRSYPIMSSPARPQVGLVARPLLGKCALVTGASRGIGAAIAKAFAAAGADVAISYSASPDKAQEVVKAIEAAGQKGYAIQADHAKQEQVVALVHALRSWGK